MEPQIEKLREQYPLMLRNIPQSEKPLPRRKLSRKFLEQLLEVLKPEENRAEALLCFATGRADEFASEGKGAQGAIRSFCLELISLANYMGDNPLLTVREAYMAWREEQSERYNSEIKSGKDDATFPPKNRGFVFIDPQNPYCGTICRIPPQK